MSTIRNCIDCATCGHPYLWHYTVHRCCVGGEAPCTDACRDECMEPECQCSAFVAPAARPSRKEGA